jgi:Uncharacterised protein family (UPF0236)
VKWFTTFGPIEVVEQLLRLGRRGVELRPFCQSAEVQPRGYSRRLQRVLADFGAEASFARAAERVKEHYRIDVPGSAVRKQTLDHGRKLSGLALKPTGRAPRQIITQMDGSMVPVMQPGKGQDGRKGKTLLWREARLCLARDAEQAAGVYGATLGTADIASGLWRLTALQAGLHDQAFVHGVGDGAPWIVDKFRENFGQQGRYLIDYYHLSEYLAAAAPTVAAKGKEHQWRRRQQGRLLNNQSNKVLRSMEAHQETAAAAETPVRDACRYLKERQNSLDYAAARHHKLPIGSGEIESAHRHVIQQRLKLAGAWWKETNLEPMLQLRVARANNLWASYWSNAKN